MERDSFTLAPHPTRYGRALMGHKLPPDQLTLYKLIDHLMLSEWDPCCTDGAPEARDEYYSYLPQVFRLAMNDASPDEIAQHLLFIEDEYMGCKGDKKLCLSVAQKIVDKKIELGL